MKKTLVIAIVSVALMSLTACGTSKTEKTSVPESSTTPVAQNETEANNSEATIGTEENVQIPSPWAEHKTISEMSEAVGFDFNAPETADGMAISFIQEMGTLAEVSYSDGEREITVRKGTDLNNISGIYNTYSEKKTLEVNGNTITLKGDNGVVNLVEWNDGVYGYSVYCEDCTTAEVISSIAEEMMTPAIGGFDNVQIPSPWTERSTIDEMVSAVDFGFNAPETADGMEISLIQEMGTLAELNYSDDEREITIRKGSGSDDVSSIYSTYPDENALEIGGKA